MIKIFFTLTSVTSETSWGQTVSLSNLTDVSNFTWRCKLLYEVLFVELGWKLKHPETPISQRAHFFDIQYNEVALACKRFLKYTNFYMILVNVIKRMFKSKLKLCNLTCINIYQKTILMRAYVWSVVISSKTFREPRYMWCQY